MTEDMTIIAERAYLAAKEMLEKARQRSRKVFFVVGCYYSEVEGATIGTYFQPRSRGGGSWAG